MTATDTQQTSLKAAALLVLERNRQRNYSATEGQKHVQLSSHLEGPKVAHQKRQFGRVATPEKRDVAHDESTPKAWREGYALLCSKPCPDDYRPVEWRQLINDTTAFMATWASQCSKLGWTLNDVFGVNPRSPVTRHDCAGLLPLLKGCKIVALTAEAATLETATGARQRYYRRLHETSEPIKPIWTIK